MNIGFFITQYPNTNPEDLRECGGAEYSTQKTAKCLALKGHQVKIFSTTLQKKRRYHEQKNLEVIQYPVQFRVISSRYSLELFLKPIVYPVDIIHAQFTVPSAFIAAWIIAKLKNIPLVVTHRSDLDPNFYSNALSRTGAKIFGKIYELVLRDADCITCPSKNFSESSIHLKNFLSKTVIVPNGIFLSDYSILPKKAICRKKLDLCANETIFLFIGALEKYKGTEILLKTFQMIIKKNPNSHLIMIGDGPLRNNLIELCITLGISSKVSIIGPIHDMSEKILFFRASDCFILPSLSESFGNVLLEAMACEIPVVATKTGGIPGIISNRINGILVTPADVQSLYHGICNLMENESLIQCIITNGKKTIKEYSWDNVIDELEKIYENVSMNHG